MKRRMAPLVAIFAALELGSVNAPAQAPRRSIAIDERLAARAGLRVGDTVILSATAGTDTRGDTVVISGITMRSADPSEIARSEFKVRVHLDHLQSLTNAGDRVGRFAVATRDVPGAVDSATARINSLAFGFRAHRAADVAVETSATFRVVNRFHRAIGVITIVASAIFLLCITLLKVDERRREVGALRLIGVSRNTVVRAVVLEASFIALIGSGMGAGFGYLAGFIVNWHYQGVYSTPLKFAIVTPGIVLFATALSLALGVIAGLVAAQRLVHRAPLDLVGR